MKPVHATIETFSAAQPGGAIRFFADKADSHEKQSPFVKGMVVSWDNPRQLRIYATEASWTAQAMVLAAIAARELGAEQITLQIEDCCHIFAIQWVNLESIEVKAVSEPWTKSMFRLALAAAKEAGAKRIGFRRVRPDGSVHPKWYPL